MFIRTEIAFGSATDVGVCCCLRVGQLRWDVMMGVLGELYFSGNIAKNSCV